MISVVIPVYNKWELTRDCLTSLARTGPEDMEVIVVDNASSDKTALACEPTGNVLFGKRFQYLRQEVNRNFAGACNIGARAAQGEWLFLLNNDTLHEPNWAEPLIRTLQNEPTLGVVGPLLVYPEDADGVQRIQHLGVVMSPSYKFSHLYHLFPATHPLVYKQRRFQVITGAAMLMRSALYHRVGGMDEKYINEFEDIDFCVRVHQEAYQTTCNPHVRMMHLCGQTRGRDTKPSINGQYLFEQCSKKLEKNKYRLLQKDGYNLSLSPWLTFDIFLPAPREQKLLRLMKKEQNEEALRRALIHEPYWMEGYKRLAAIYEQKNDFLNAVFFLQLAAQIQPDPEIFCALYRLSCKQDVENIDVFSALQHYCLEPQERLQRLRVYRREFKHAFPSLAEDADALLATESRFFAEKVAPLRQLILNATS